MDDQRPGDGTHRIDGFRDFVEAAEPRIRHALTGLFGVEGGREAAAEAFAYAWEHWDRIAAMDNPVGYVYVTGRSRGRRRRLGPAVLPEPPADGTPLVEPGLAEALSDLPARQRQAAMLVHAYGWSLTEAAEVLDVSKATVQKHVDRAMAKLRARLGVTP